MCGIAGIYHLDNRTVDKGQLNTMAKLIRHRGPDDEGFLLVNTANRSLQHLSGTDTVPEIRSAIPTLDTAEQANLALGFRRLSIVDVSAHGHQPMSVKGGSVWITFNGEIYNYIELREELISKGYTFASAGDTEVILNAYLEWGEACLDKLVGMFAFAIWDNDNQKLFCARDRVGIKPFYYYQDANNLYWASEVKQLTKSGLVRAELNEGVLGLFLLQSRQNVSEETFFNNINELPPAHKLVVTGKKVTISRYWDINPANKLNGYSDQEYAEQFLELFSDVVKLHLRSDVRLGIALSGGLDSSSIACVASNIVKQPINTFSVFYEEHKKYDEREFINEVLALGGFEPSYFTATTNISTDEIEQWTYFQDEPCLGGSPFSAYKNYENVRRNSIKVVLNGQGGDELLAGYLYYYKYYFVSLLKEGKIGRFMDDFNAYRRTYGHSAAEYMNTFAKVMMRVVLPDSTMKKMEHLENSNSGFYASWLSDKLPKVPVSDKFSNQLDNNLYNTLTSYSIPHLLHWEDRNSMAHSIESRVPFLDHRLIEFAYSLPVEQKIKGNETKYILRQAMKGVLPEKIRQRKDKIGFGTPTDSWTDKLLRNYITDVFSSPEFKSRGVFNADKIRKAYTEKSGSFTSGEIWKILSAEIWMRAYL